MPNPTAGRSPAAAAPQVDRPVAAPSGRPRDARADEAILRAALEMVAEEGLAGLSMDRLAARAGVGKATIYRRWRSREEVVLEALRGIAEQVSAPDTGSLEGDGRQLVTLFVDALQSTPAGKVLPHLVAGAALDPAVAEQLHAFMASRRAPWLAALRRAVARGELPADADIELLADMTGGAVVHKLLLRGETIDAGYIEGLVAHIARASALLR